MAHGYLPEYDDSWDRGEDRNRERDWRERGERDWRERGQDSNIREPARDRGFLFGQRERDDNRGSSAWENNRDWPQGDRSRYGGANYGREQGYGRYQSDERSAGRQDQSSQRRDYSAHPDDHYRSWRDRQMQALDQDYADYCREREQKFHQEFDQWRQNRQPLQGQQPQATQQQQRQQGAGSEPVMELNNPTVQSGEAQGTASPTADATLGTNNSENTGPGRARG